jgi:hypothetical protein
VAQVVSDVEGGVAARFEARRPVRRRTMAATTRASQPSGSVPSRLGREAAVDKGRWVATLNERAPTPDVLDSIRERFASSLWWIDHCFKPVAIRIDSPVFWGVPAPLAPAVDGGAPVPAIDAGG